MRLSEGNPFKTCANPQAHDLLLSRANRYENEMVSTYRDLNCSGASPRISFGHRNVFLHLRTKGLLMVVSKRWFEFSGGTKFRYHLLPQFNLLLTSNLPLFNLFFTFF